MPHRLLAALCILAASASPALAQEGGRPVPPPDEMAFAPRPRAVEVVSGHAAVAAQVDARSAQLASCTPRTRATFVRTRVKLRWNARGAVRSVAVSGPGGGAFARCVSRALRGALVARPPRAGSGSAVVIIRRAVERTPAPAGKAALQRCTVDADCTIHFQSHACIPGDPVAVNGRDMIAVRAAFPVRHIECGMGGPQYMDLRMANEGRYSAACEASRCVVRDAGPRPTSPGF